MGPAFRVPQDRTHYPRGHFVLIRELMEKEGKGDGRSEVCSSRLQTGWDGDNRHLDRTG